MGDDTGREEFEQVLSSELSQYQARRYQRYKAVNVLLISWEEDDLGCGTEIAALRELFVGLFGYEVWPCAIPSSNSQAALAVRVARFVECFGGEENLIIVYYGGHGVLNRNSRSPCIWAAQIEDGPTLDWSVIQPLLFGSGSDVAIFLDCCYAGQAARSHCSESVEFLAATDKDQGTPSGKAYRGPTYPSFTEVLMREMEDMMNKGDSVTLPELARRMVTADSGLRRQPFYIPLGGGSNAGKIRLTRLQQLGGIADSQIPEMTSTSLSVRLSFFSPLDLGTVKALTSWMTRDSPSHINNIQLARQTLSDAFDANSVVRELIKPEAQTGEPVRPYLSNEGQLEAIRLLESLKTALANPRPPNMADSDVQNIIEDIQQKSHDLIKFVSDSLSHLGVESLYRIESRTLSGNKDLRNRIAMRLTLLRDNVDNNRIRVSFEGPSTPDQRLRTGKRHNLPVMVEYFYPPSTDDKALGNIERQVARISALQSEPKGEHFRILPGLGFLFESLQGPRFGFVYELPENRVGRRHLFLSELMGKLKVVPLDTRAQTAFALCDALLHLHSIGWYHQGIKSENVLVFESQSEGGRGGDSSNIHSGWDLKQPYLIGFDSSRPIDAETRNTIDFTAKNNMYRHPDRWGRSLRFEQHHDLYALGVLLIEIACWKTLPSMDNRRSNFDYIKDPAKLQDFLLRIADDKVSHAAGMGFTESIKHCLRSERWQKYEDWQFQSLVREKVMRPIQILSESHEKPNNSRWSQLVPGC